MPFTIMLIIPLNVVNTLLTVGNHNVPGSIFFRIKLLAAMNLTAGGTVLVMRFTGRCCRGKTKLIRTALRTMHIHLHPVVVASLTFNLNIMPLTVDANMNSNNGGTVNATMLNNVLDSAFLNVFFVPVFFIMMRHVFDHNGSGSAASSAPPAGRRWWSGRRLALGPVSVLV